MLKSAIVILIALTLTAKANAETPAHQILNYWLAAINGRDEGRLKDFWQKYSHEGVEDRVAHDRQLVTMTQGFTLYKVTKDEDSHLEAILKEGRGSYSDLVIDLDSTNPPMVQRIFGHPIPAPSPGDSTRAANDTDLLKRVAEHVAHPQADNPFSGAVLIAHNDKLIVQQAWGMADRSNKTKNTVETQFCLGSMNKMFTAVAVLQLVKEGRLSLDQTIDKYLPAYPNHDLAAHVTVCQLLTHRGGTGDIFTPEYEARRLETKTLSDYVNLFGNRPTEFEPGSKMKYSNYGFILLGRLVEVASGESYDNYVQKHIFGPAAMTHTESRPEIEHVPGRAVGYTKTPDGMQPNTSGLPWSGTSAGGGYSTVGDLLLFAKALESGKLLDGALLNEATTDQTRTGYGFGFCVLPEGGFGHGGGSPGMNGEMHILPHTGYVIIALANQDPFMATDMVRYIETQLPI